MTKRIAILMCSRHLRFDKVRTAREQVLAGEGQAHYMRGGKPGYFPSLKKNIPHPIPLDFWDPLGFTKKMSDEKKELMQKLRRRAPRPESSGAE